MTTSTPAPSPRFRVVRGARSLLDLRPIEEVPFHVAVESAFKEGQIVALVSVDDPRLQTGERAWSKTAPTTAEVMRIIATLGVCHWWTRWKDDMIPCACRFDVRDGVVYERSPAGGWISPIDCADDSTEYAPCLPPGVEDGEIKRLREAVKALVAGCNPAYGKPREWIVSRDLVTALVAAIGAA